MKFKPGPYGKRRYQTIRPRLSITMPYTPAANTTNPGEGSAPLAAYWGRSGGREPVVKSMSSPVTFPFDHQAMALSTYRLSASMPRTGIVTESDCGVTAGVMVSGVEGTFARRNVTATLSAPVTLTETTALRTLCGLAATVTLVTTGATARGPAASAHAVIATRVATRGRVRIPGLTDARLDQWHQQGWGC